MKAALAQMIRYLATGAAAVFCVPGGVLSFLAAGFAGLGLWLENVGHDYADRLQGVDHSID